MLPRRLQSQHNIAASALIHAGMLLQILAHNQISSLDGLAVLRGTDCRLNTLDVRGNALTALSQLAPLAEIRQLTHLRLDDGLAGDARVMVLLYSRFYWQAPPAATAAIAL